MERRALVITAFLPATIESSSAAAVQDLDVL